MVARERESERESRVRERDGGPAEILRRYVRALSHPIFLFTILRSLPPPLRLISLHRRGRRGRP